MKETIVIGRTQKGWVYTIIMIEEMNMIQKGKLISDMIELIINIYLVYFTLISFHTTAIF